MNIDYPNGMKAAELYICDGDIKEYNTNFYCINFFVKNQKGYRNLCKLVSIAMTKGYIIKPRINHNILEQYKEGLICLQTERLRKDFLMAIKMAQKKLLNIIRIYSARIFIYHFKTLMCNYQNLQKSWISKLLLQQMRLRINAILILFFDLLLVVTPALVLLAILFGNKNPKFNFIVFISPIIALVIFILSNVLNKVNRYRRFSEWIFFFFYLRKRNRILFQLIL